ncbi:FkbM family methyltransferase [Akkermansiaceae bacterium]|nr:FkbM family methyltransferase [Akkermansiaceae bacterium]
MINLIKKFSRKLGYDFIRYDARRSPELCLVGVLKLNNTQVVIDIGANVGQYGLSLREFNYQGEIHSFEPLTNAHKKLISASNDDPSWVVADRCAVGAEKGSTTINISGNSVSSSLLDIAEAHTDAAPSSSYVGSEETPVRSLNEIIPEILEPGQKCHLKIDTQGYERFVIDGVLDVIDSVDSIELELSLSCMYEGGWLAHEALNRMSELGFRLFNVFPFFADQKTGETFQMDALFVRI